MNITPINLGLIRGLYRTSYWDHKPFITGGAPPCMDMDMEMEMDMENGNGDGYINIL